MSQNVVPYCARSKNLKSSFPPRSTQNNLICQGKKLIPVNQSKKLKKFPVGGGSWCIAFLIIKSNQGAQPYITKQFGFFSPFSDNQTAISYKVAPQAYTKTRLSTWWSLFFFFFLFWNYWFKFWLLNCMQILILNIDWTNTNIWVFRSLMPAPSLFHLLNMRCYFFQLTLFFQYIFLHFH